MDFLHIRISVLVLARLLCASSQATSAATAYLIVHCGPHLNGSVIASLLNVGQNLIHSTVIRASDHVILLDCAFIVLSAMLIDTLRPVLAAQISLLLVEIRDVSSQLRLLFKPVPHVKGLVHRIRMRLDFALNALDIVIVGPPCSLKLVHVVIRALTLNHSLIVTCVPRLVSCYISLRDAFVTRLTA